ncbi:MAG: tetratricopeptide repeat protein [Planctomycetes bacterium]|nr:tetratricopeptide repeat protein [Planctomycetota bacterium]
MSRKLLISLTISSAHPNLLGWLKEFTSGDRGSDELRMEAMFKLRKIDAIDGEQRRFFSKGKWIQAEIPLLTVHGEPKFAVSDQVKRLLDQAVAFLGQRMFKQAEEACREAIRIDPKQVVAYNNLATSLLNQNRLREAEQTLKHVLTIDDLNVTARVNLARLASYKGNEEQAEEWVRPVRKLESLHYADLGSLISYDFANAISRRDFLAARQHLNMLKDAVPNYPQIPQFERMIP